MSDLSREQFEAAVIERMKESGQVPWIGGEAVIEAETFAESDIRLICGDCLETMRTLPDNSVDSVVTDPPYGLSFMGKKWDYDVPSTEIWAECLRVLKPGGHLLAFAGTRTQHRMAVRIEDAGFEIRDMIAWVYGSGFPKSGNTALKPALEPITMARKPLIGTVAANVLKFGTGALSIDGCRVGSESTTRTQRGTTKAWEGGAFSGEVSTGSDAGRWPANLIHDGSPEVLAAFPDTKSGGYPAEGGQRSQVSTFGKPTARGEQKFTSSEGSAARFFYCAKASRKDRHEGMEDPGPQFQHGNTLRKVESAETQGNNHPTVKPTDLMRYLCRLVTPAGGLVLDPFMGSGSTGKAASLEGFRFVGIELDPDYFAIAKARVRPIERQQDAQRDLFSDESR